MLSLIKNFLTRPAGPNKFPQKHCGIIMQNRGDQEDDTN